MKHEQEFVYELVSEKLVLFIPELQDAYERELEWWGSEVPGPHVLYAQIVSPYISELLVTGTDEALKRVFDFVEHLATSADDRVKGLVADIICEPLLPGSPGLVRARRYMGAATRRILKICNKID